MTKSAFTKFDPTESHTLSQFGWDAWAEEYADLPQINSTYRLSKKLLYSVLDSELGTKRRLEVLDFTCGCGNDFEYLLAAGHHIVGCDGSAGMLSVAARRYPDALAKGAVTLYHGQAEALTVNSFEGRRFDAIISSTGGMAYLNDEELTRIHTVFSELLKPGGCMIITHLLPRCLNESLYYVLHIKPRAALRRWQKKLDISIKTQTFTMYLRSRRDLNRILNEIAPADRMVPLSVLIPPFQTGYRLPERLAGVMMRAELALQRWGIGLSTCDQLAWIVRR